MRETTQAYKTGFNFGAVSFTEPVDGEFQVNFVGPSGNVSKMFPESLFKNLQRWLKGEHIQNAFPTLTPGERELFITGIDEKLWDEMFRE